MSRPSLAVWKFSSCDGCQLALLDLEDHLLALADQIEIAHFAEATTTHRDGPYTVSLVEGSISTPRDVDRIRRIREESETLVAIGACATAGGIQALRNTRSLDTIESVYPRPETVEYLATSTPISEHVDVDVELRGCPVNRIQLLEVVSALVAGRRPRIPTTSVCAECKRRGVACVMVAGRLPCLGPVTMAGCWAICPAFGRGCYGCFGPAETVSLEPLRRRWRELGMDDDTIERALHSFNAGAFSGGDT